MLLTAIVNTTGKHNMLMAITIQIPAVLLMPGTTLTTTGVINKIPNRSMDTKVSGIVIAEVSKQEMRGIETKLWSAAFFTGIAHHPVAQFDSGF